MYGRFGTNIRRFERWLNGIFTVAIENVGWDNYYIYVLFEIMCGALSWAFQCSVSFIGKSYPGRRFNSLVDTKYGT